MKIELTPKECRIIAASIAICSKVIGSTPEFDDDRRAIIKKMLNGAEENNNAS